MVNKITPLLVLNKRLEELESKYNRKTEKIGDIEADLDSRMELLKENKKKIKELNQKKNKLEIEWEIAKRRMEETREAIKQLE